MVARSKLKVALAAEKGLTDKKVKQIKDKKKHKAVIKDKRKKGLLPEKDESEDDEDYEDDEEDDEEDSDAENGLFDMEAEESEGDESEDEEVGGTTSAAALMNESDTDSESEVEMEAKIQRVPNPKPILKTAASSKATKAEAKKAKDDDEDEEEDEEESDIALSDLEDMNDSDREDLYVKTRLSINNGPALLASLKRIAIPHDGSVPFSTHQLVASSEPTASKIEDISDDLNRELQLYAQSLEAAKKARSLLRAEGMPFSRPNDYFAEMVKDDGHMEKVKAKLVEEATNKKAATEARKLRDLKKFGKQVQVAKIQERHKQKRETLEKIKDLKKKRSENGNGLNTNEADLFDVGVDNELNSSGKRGRSGDDRGGRGGPSKRAKKDAKFGFGGKKRHAKSGDAVSSGDLSGFNARQMKGQGGPAKRKPLKTARLGKSKRVAKAGKR
ncbi:eukaryotic rRNA processing protein EBP2-domain-containing protein [Coniella lustricola]|uniref:Eukaryotic rRNA processing protein EBP2-domain-containing protein n=1 Tax=Coniella lustricola TaxID=2025994 RepID=A0A2T3ALC4_9PEZI|nr:eukaryotic rRNA processing protein EBP2-domain-containing protein [Coniella lustricola]